MYIFYDTTFEDGVAIQLASIWFGYASASCLIILTESLYACVYINTKCKQINKWAS